MVKPTATHNEPVIEFVYPEFCNQAGDNGNAMYLKKCFPQACFHETNYLDEPLFATQDVDLLCMANMTEFQQELTLEKLKPLRCRLQELMLAGVPMLFTGSAAELLGNYIERDGRKIEALGLMDFYTRDMAPRRYCDVFMGYTQNGNEIVGFKAQFSQVVGNNQENYFCKVHNGFGLNESSKYEGFRINNCIATWVIGPILPLNPQLVEWLIHRFGTGKIACEEAAYKAHNHHVEQFKNPNFSLL